MHAEQPMIDNHLDDWKGDGDFNTMMNGRVIMMMMMVRVQRPRCVLLCCVCCYCVIKVLFIVLFCYHIGE